MLPNSRPNRNNLPPTQPHLINLIANRITNEQAQSNFFQQLNLLMKMNSRFYVIEPYHREPMSI